MLSWFTKKRFYKIVYTLMCNYLTNPLIWIWSEWIHAEQVSSTVQCWIACAESLLSHFKKSFWDIILYNCLSVIYYSDSHTGANQVKKCTSLAPPMKRNGVCVLSADGRQDRLSDNCWHVWPNTSESFQSFCNYFWGHT